MRSQLHRQEDGGGAVSSANDADGGGFIRVEAHEQGHEERGGYAHLGRRAQKQGARCGEQRAEVRQGSYAQEDDGRENFSLDAQPDPVIQAPVDGGDQQFLGMLAYGHVFACGGNHQGFQLLRFQVHGNTVAAGVKVIDALLADDGGSFSVREQEDRLIAVVLRHVLEVLQVGVHRQAVVAQAGRVGFGFFLGFPHGLDFGNGQLAAGINLHGLLHGFQILGAGFRRGQIGRHLGGRLLQRSHMNAQVAHVVQGRGGYFPLFIGGDDLLVQLGDEHSVVRNVGDEGAESNGNHQERFVLLGYTQIQEQDGNAPHPYHLP